MARKRKTAKQRTKRGRRLERQIGLDGARTETKDHVIPLVLDTGKGLQPLYVAFTAGMGGGEAVEIGLCDGKGELVGRMRMMAEDTMTLFGQITETVVGAHRIAEAQAQVAAATVH